MLPDEWDLSLQSKLKVSQQDRPSWIYRRRTGRQQSALASTLLEEKRGKDCNWNAVYGVGGKKEQLVGSFSPFPLFPKL